MKIFSGTFSITGTGAVTLPAGSVLDASVAVVNAATTVPTDIATISSISGSTINVVVVQQAAAANSIETVAKNVSVIAVVQ